ncbi:hypothetical protein ACTV1J_000539 [Cronobacter turicensis]
MKEHPIIFNAEMVRAVLSGNKTQTRRIVNPQPELTKGSGFSWNGALYGAGSDERETNRNFAHVKCPHGKPGDRLWVRETWSDVNSEGCPAVAYRADSDTRLLAEIETFRDEDGVLNTADPRLDKYWFAAWSGDLFSGTEGSWRPSIHMPRWASRITLEITGVRVERLASISSDDARAEGYPAARAADGGNIDPWLWFRDLWDGIYPEQSFKANPWVWVIEFKRIEGGAA